MPAASPYQFRLSSHACKFMSSLYYCVCLQLIIISLSFFISWPETYPDGVHTEGLLIGNHNDQALFVWVWFYCILWWFLQDIIKVWVWRIMKVHNILNVNNTGKVIYSASTLVKMNRIRDELNSKPGAAVHHV